MAAKYEQLASILRSEVQQILRQGGSKLATEAELSQRYHMSRQTVRHALKLLEDENLIERRQGSGSYIRQSGRSDDVHQIAVITTFLDDYIFPSILHDVQSSFAEAGTEISTPAVKAIKRAMLPPAPTPLPATI